MGRVVRPGIDPQWLDTDRGYALAWQEDKRATCSCGTRHDEWDPKLGGDREAYVVETTYCRGHALLGEAQKELPKTADGRPIPGFMTFLRPPRPEDDETDDD